MKTFIINLGLGNSPFESINDKAERRMEVHDSVHDLAAQYGVNIEYEWAEGQYEGKTEETMVITVTAPGGGHAYEFVMSLVKKFTQECVALYDVEHGRGILMYSDSVTTNKHIFDPSFFIMPTSVRDRIMARLPKG